MRALEIINGEKACSGCGETKKLELFYRKNNRRHKYLSQCKDCTRKYQIDHRIKTKKQCPACGKEILRLSNYCRECSHRTAEYLTKFKANRKYPTRRSSFCVDCGTKVGLRSKFCVRCRSVGERNAAWKGGVVILKERIRDLFEYRQWRSDVFTRDKFTCINCGNIGGKLQAHHVIPMNVLMQKYEITSIEAAKNCSELFNLNNGETLCEGCHRDLHKEKGLKYEFREH